MMGNKSNDAIFESLEKEFTSAIVRLLPSFVPPPSTPPLTLSLLYALVAV
jgi:hypothetical protein